MIEQLKSVDYNARKVKFVEKADTDTKRSLFKKDLIIFINLHGQRVLNR